MLAQQATRHPHYNSAWSLLASFNASSGLQRQSLAFSLSQEMTKVFSTCIIWVKLILIIYDCTYAINPPPAVVHDAPDVCLFLYILTSLLISVNKLRHFTKYHSNPSTNVHANHCWTIFFFVVWPRGRRVPPHRQAARLKHDNCDLGPKRIWILQLCKDKSWSS